MAARFLEDRPALSEDPRRARIREAHRADEAACVAELLELATVDERTKARIRARALELAGRVRRAGGDQLGVEAFLHEYQLSTREGIMLMCLAEALLRIPDADTADRLIRDKLSAGEWSRHLGRSGSLLVNASTWGLMLTGRVVRANLEQEADPGAWLTRLLHRLGEPVLRQALLQSMRVLGRHFVLGQTIEQAIRRAGEAERKGYRYSYDMLGEAARTAADAEAYHLAYRDAIAAISQAAQGGDLMARPGISIKLSALHPRYELAQHSRLHAELYPRVLELLQGARAGNIAVTIDAEESDRLEPSLDLFERLAAAPELAGWDGLGLAVQAYQKRAIHVIAWLEALAVRERRRIPVRLVKGAYWDSEIKRTQEQGLDDYPVFTRKLATDVSYLACARRLLAGGDAFYPQFATHNAQTLGSIIELSGNRRDFEFQRLHGMGEALYEGLVGAEEGRVACRVYAPVGSHQDLLPYLVRRLLENGANTSFVNRILDENVPLETLVEDPASPLGAPRAQAPSQDPAARRAVWPRAAQFERHRSARSGGAGSSGRAAGPGFRARLPGAAWHRGRAGRGARGDRPGRSLVRRRQRDRDRPRDHRTGGARSSGRICQLGTHAACGTRRVSAACGRPVRGERGRAARLVRARRPARPCPMRSPRCARRWISCATTPWRRRPGQCRASCRGRPARPTSCPCTAAACSSRSARGTSRSPSSPARLPPRSWSAMRCSRSLRPRPR